MSFLFSDYDINSEEMNPSSNSSKTLFSISNMNNSSTTNSTKINETSIQEELENNYFLEINTKNSFNINYKKYYADIENKLNKELQTNSDLELKLTNSYLNTLFPKCNQDPFLISQYISKLLYSNQKKKINKEIENQIEFFVEKHKKLKNNLLSLNINNIKIIGYILHSSYNNFKSYNIDNIKKFQNAVNDVIKNQINIYNDYSNFCVERQKEEKDYNISKFISKKKNNYILPCELIFLMNYLNNINVLDINFEDLNLEQNDLFLYTLALINIKIIFPKINFIKINIINIKLHKDIYSRFFRLEKNLLKKSNKYIKSFNYCNDNNKIFSKKWDFTTNFYVMEKRVLSNNNTNLSNNNYYHANLMNDKIHINEIISKNSNILSSILITFFSFSEFININKFELIVNDSYTHEYQYFFKKYCFMDIPPFFHILNLIKNKDNIKSLNVEINSLDNITAKKIFYLIYKNNSLTELNISFFASSVSYTQQTIYRLYSQYIKKDNKIFFIEEPEIEMLNSLNKYFERNLNIIFDIIVKKNNLNKLGLYFEVPSILINNQKYMILILKFIINILFLIDEENSKINTLTLLSPYTILDKASFPCIDDYLDDIEIYEKNQSLLYLNLQLKIYKIVNIKKLISTNLLILNIGDFDLTSFEILINYLTSYKFSLKSNLKCLTLGLLKSIIDYNNDINILFNRLYSIKIQHLFEVNIYTNLIIDSNEKYLDLISTLNYHWITSSTIILNNISSKIFEQYKDYINNINYLNPFFIDDIKLNDKNKNNISICYLYLKYFLTKKYKESHQLKDKFNHLCDKIIYGIFKYLCYERKMIISHSLKVDSNNKKLNIN